MIGMDTVGEHTHKMENISLANSFTKEHDFGDTGTISYEVIIYGSKITEADLLLDLQAPKKNIVSRGLSGVLDNKVTNKLG